MTTYEERLSRLEGVYEHLASKSDVSELRADLQSQIADLKIELQKANGRLDTVDGRLNAFDSRFDAVDSRFDRIEARLDKLIFALFGAGLAFGIGMVVLIVRSFAGG